APYRLLFPLGFLSIGAYQVMVYYATQQGAFKIISQTKVYQGLIGPITQIVFGLCRMGAWGLLIGFIIGQSTGVGKIFSQLVTKSRDSMRGMSASGMLAIAKRFSRFPLLSSWSALIN